jgi:hypothetical protein
VPSYTDNEYEQYLHDKEWTRPETDVLFDLCRRFELKFLIIHDRWNNVLYRDRSVEDLKERYYAICTALEYVRCFVDVRSYLCSKSISRLERNVQQINIISMRHMNVDEKNN